MAERLKRERPDDLDGQIERGLELALCRPVDPSEIDAMRELVGELRREDGLDATQALESMCLLILNLNEFMHVR